MKTQTQPIEFLVSVDWRGAFQGQLQATGRSARTVSAYLQDVRAFASWAEEVNGQPFTPDLLTGVDLRAYRAWAVQRCKPATWNRRRISLAVFSRWSFENGYVNYDPFQGVEPVEQVELPPRWLERAEYQRFMRALEQAVNGARTEAWQRQALRDQAMIALMVYAGLREGEVVALDAADVEISERKGRVVVRSGKGEKRREVPLNSECRKAVKTWMEYSGEGPLFIGKSGGRAVQRRALTVRAVQRRVAEIGRAAGLVVTPHDLRHTFAKRALDGGAPLTVVSKLLGHARLETTARYVQPGWGDFEKAVENI